MTERVYKIAMLGNEGVGKTGKWVSVFYLYQGLQEYEI